MLRKSVVVGAFAFYLSTAAAAGAADFRLVESARQGDQAAVRSLLEAGADVNLAQGDGMTALHWAVYGDDVETARILLQAGADPQPRTRVDGRTPLFLAAGNGNAETVRLLLEAGADPNQANDLGTTPLMQAAAAGQVETVRALLDDGADVNARENTRRHTALIFAAGLDRADVVRLLAERGADLNVTSGVVAIAENLIDEDGNPIPAPSRTGETRRRPRGAGQVLGTGGWAALHYAAREGYIETARALVEAGADINKVNTLDRTSPLVLAISNGNYDLAKRLLDQGADPNLANVDGLAPLYAVLESRWAPVSWTPTPATAAAGVAQQKIPYLDLMHALLERGADPNHRLLGTVWFNPPHHHDEWAKVPGTTAFWRAAQATDVRAMRLLVEYGADPRIFSDSGVSPLSVAAGIGWSGNYSTNAPDGYLAASKYLVEEIGLEVNVADNVGFTPLMGAAWRGDNELVKYLLEKGADIQARNANGWAVTDMANGPSLVSSVPKKYPETIALLLAHGAPELIRYDDEEILGIIKRRYDPVTGQFIVEGEAQPWNAAAEDVPTEEPAPENTNTEGTR